MSIKPINTRTAVAVLALLHVAMFAFTAIEFGLWWFKIVCAVFVAHWIITLFYLRPQKTPKVPNPEPPASIGKCFACAAIGNDTEATVVISLDLPIAGIFAAKKPLCLYHKGIAEKLSLNHAHEAALN